MKYLIAFNQEQSNYNSNAIHEIIKGMKVDGVLDWWHYLPNIYILDTSDSLNEKGIADKIIARAPGQLFIVVSVNLSMHNGVLPKEAWGWIAKKTRAILKVKPSPAPPEDLFTNPFGPYNQNPLTDLFSKYKTPTPRSGSKLLSDILGKKLD